jgi:hypothetical protein
MSIFTFKDYLITEAKKTAPKKKEKAEFKFFNPQRFVPKMEKVLDLLIKKSAMEGEMANELVTLEMISIFKEVLIDRLSPYKDPEYTERKGKDEHIETMDRAKQEVEDVLRLQFSENGYRSAINSFMALIVNPILDEVKRVTPKNVAHLLDDSRFDHKAKDAFGHLMRYVINSVIIPNAEDAEVAKNVLAKWGAEARKKAAKKKKLTKQQRLQVIRNAVEKVQGNKKEK